MTGGPFVARGARIWMRREVGTWWERLLDRVWPPVVRYLRGGVLVVMVNGVERVRVSLALARVDGAVACVEFFAPLVFQDKDEFGVRIEFDRAAPATMLLRVLLDGEMQLVPETPQASPGARE